MSHDEGAFPVKTVLALLGGVLLVVLVVALQVLLSTAQQEAKPSSQPDAELKRLLAQQQELLTSYGWVDRAKGTVHIPVDRAMDLVAAEHGQK